MKTFLETNALSPKRPTFLCGGWYHDEIATHLGGGTPGFKTWPVGPCDRIRPDSQHLSLDQWVQEAGVLPCLSRVPLSLACLPFCLSGPMRVVHAVSAGNPKPFAGAWHARIRLPSHSYGSFPSRPEFHPCTFACLFVSARVHVCVWARVCVCLFRQTCKK